ncbi:hypothetical protein AAHA92_03295 [Salvia divinorum]|uniref:Uncharacterized protein n=1 Tax=Salvia divinorum TaxID=28513 RepID=A0ABD1IKR8_SALDI
METVVGYMMVLVLQVVTSLHRCGVVEGLDYASTDEVKKVNVSLLDEYQTASVLNGFGKASMQNWSKDYAGGLETVRSMAAEEAAVVAARAVTETTSITAAEMAAVEPEEAEIEAEAEAAQCFADAAHFVAMAFIISSD